MYSLFHVFLYLILSISFLFFVRQMYEKMYSIWNTPLDQSFFDKPREEYKKIYSLLSNSSKGDLENNNENGSSLQNSGENVLPTREIQEGTISLSNNKDDLKQYMETLLGDINTNSSLQDTSSTSVQAESSVSTPTPNTQSIQLDMKRIQAEREQELMKFQPSSFGNEEQTNSIMPQNVYSNSSQSIEGISSNYGTDIKQVYTQ